MGRRHAPGATAERPEVLTDVLITGIHPSGAGIARLSDNSKSKDVPEILVPGALPGARGDLFWNPPKPGGHWGLAVEWRESAPSPDADPSRCPHAASLNGQPVCGGCPLGSLKYSAELALKTKLLIEEPLRQAGLWREGLIQPPSGQPEAFAQHFRNKAVLYPSVIDGIGRFGYYAARSQILVPAEDCPQTPVWMEEAARTLAPFLSEPALTPAPEAAVSNGTGVLRSLLLREAPGSGERMAVLVVRALTADLLAAKEKLIAALAPCKLQSLLINVHPTPGSAVLSFAPDALVVWAGRSSIEAELMDLAFTLGPQTFLQVNTPQTPVLYEKALDAADVQPGDQILDLYCGVGTITLAAARRAGPHGRALGVERVEASIICARENAARNSIPQAAFAAEPTETFLSAALKEGFPEGFKPTKIIVDPAYQGIAGGAAKALADLFSLPNGPKRLAYVSCNPKSFARDAKELAAAGLTLESISPVDLFPGAMHLELVAAFSCKKTLSAA